MRAIVLDALKADGSRLGRAGRIDILTGTLRRSRMYASMSEFVGE